MSAVEDAAAAAEAASSSPLLEKSSEGGGRSRFARPLDDDDGGGTTAPSEDDDASTASDHGDPERDCLRRVHFSFRYHLSVILRLTPQLLRFLLCGTPKWILKLLRLLMFVVSLLPAFVRFGWYYWAPAWFGGGDRIVVGYKEGGGSRHLADVYGSATPSTATPSAAASSSATSRGAREEGGSAAARGGSREDATHEEEAPPLKPVVIFLTGGAWIIGYKMWGALLSRVLVPFGILVVIPDYRNFPQVSVEGMVSDVDCSVQWTLDNIERYGGDPTKVVLVGQSAGAHLGSCLVAIKCLLELDPGARRTYPLTSTYKLSSLRGFVPMSGPYDLIRMRTTFHEHGLDKNLIGAIFGGMRQREDEGGAGVGVERYSPAHILRRCVAVQERNDETRERRTNDDGGGGGKNESDNGDDIVDPPAKTTIGEILPPIRLLHGTADKTVPCDECVAFAEQLRSACCGSSSPNDDPTCQIDTLLYEGWSHTDPILEGPMDGDQRFHREVHDRVREWTATDDDDDGSWGAAMTTTTTLREFDDDAPACQPMCPKLLIWLGRAFNPF